MNEKLINELIEKYLTQAAKLSGALMVRRQEGMPTDYYAGVSDTIVATIVELRHILENDEVME